MGEYVQGFELIREPDRLLETGEIVPTHQHNFHHNTDFTMGYWEIHRFQPIVGPDGKQQIHRVQKQRLNGLNVETYWADELAWLEMPIEKIRGGGPHCTIGIPKNMRHEFKVLEGPAFYRCRFANRDRNGNLSEEWLGFKKATE